MSSSSSRAGSQVTVLPLGTELKPLETPELRTGNWTRLGNDAVLGDPVTEQLLSALAETTRNAARSQGYAVGWAEGQRAARLEAEEEARRTAEVHRSAEQQRESAHRAAVAALTEAAVRLEAAVAVACADIEDRSAGLAADLTATILGAAATDVDAVRRALMLTPDGPMSRIRVHPDDAATLDPTAAAELAERCCLLVADPGLDRGDALVEYDGSVLDLRLSSALERVREVLR